MLEGWQGTMSQSLRADGGLAKVVFTGKSWTSPAFSSGLCKYLYTVSISFAAKRSSNCSSASPRRFTLIAYLPKLFASVTYYYKARMKSHAEFPGAKEVDYSIRPISAMRHDEAEL